MSWKFNRNTKKWENLDLSGAPSDLGELTDIDFSTIAPTEGSVLKYTGGKWRPGSDNVGTGDSSLAFEDMSIGELVNVIIPDTTAPVVSISPSGGTYTSIQSITLSSNESNTNIYYTLDGTDPKTSGTKQTYSSAINISTNKTLKYYGVDTSGNESTVQTATYVINLTIATTGVTLDKTTASLETGATTQLSANVAPANATNKTVTWSSDNTSIATVNSSGLVTSIAAGSTVITATTQDGNFTATCDLTVTEAVQEVTDVTGLSSTNTTDISTRLTWTGTAASYDVYEGAVLLGNTTNMYYDIAELVPSSTYEFTVKAKDAQGNESQGVSVSVTTNADAGAQEYFYALDGVNDGLTISSITADEYVFDVEFGLRNPSTSQTLVNHNYEWISRGTLSDSWGPAENFTVYVNGVAVTNNTGFFAANERMTVRVVRTAPIAGALNFFKSWGATNYLEANVYDIKVYNIGVLKAHYDMSTQTLTDQSGNGTILTVVGDGTFELPEPPDTTGPAVVTNVTETHTASSVLLSWTNPTDIDFSHVKIRKDGVEIAATDEQSYLDTNLVDNTTYNYQLIAVDTNGNQSAPVSISAKTDIGVTPPGEVTNLVITKTDTTVNFTWTNPTDADFSHVEILRNNVVVLTNVTNGAFGDSGLIGNTEYTYKLVTVDTAGNKSNGITQIVRTEIPPGSTFKLFMDGQKDWLETTTNMTYTRVLMDIMIYPHMAEPSLSGQHVYQTTGGTVNYANGTSLDTIPSDATVKVDDVAVATNTNFIPENIRFTLDIIHNTVKTSKFSLLSSLQSSLNKFPTRGCLYDVKVYNGETLVAHYDFLQRAITDQTGNNNNLTLNGGTWYLESETPIDTTVPAAVTNLRTTSITDTSITLAWDDRLKPVDLNRYDIYQDGVLIGNTLSKTHQIANLTADTLYVFDIKGVDNTGNEAVTASAKFKTTGGIIVASPSLPVIDGMVLNLDMSGKEGLIQTSWTDSVNNIPAVISNQSTTFDNINYGFVDNKGVKLKPGGKIELNTSSLPINPALGYTIEFAVYLNPANFQFINNTNKLTANTSNVFNFNFAYINTSGVETFHGFGSLAGIQEYTHMENGSKKTAPDTLDPQGELNIFTFRFQPNGTVDVVRNEYKGSYSAITDFSSYPNYFNTSTFTVGGNSTLLQDYKFKSITVYNRSLTDQEIIDNYHFRKLAEPMEKLSITPSQINIAKGATQVLTVTPVPRYYKNLASLTYTSGNVGFATVNASGLVTGVYAGDTHIDVSATYGEKTLQEFVPVTVTDSSGAVEVGTSSRNIEGISINKQVSEMHVGEACSIMATTIPYDIFYDNIVIWESSNPAVCSSEFGVLKALSVGTATITAYDSTRNYSESFTVTVSEPIPVIITAEETYTVNVVDYGIKIDNTDSTNTTNGIQAALDYASTNGYKKIVFPYGTYLVNPTVRTIYWPSDTLIDFSDAIINIEPSTKTATGYIMFWFKDVENTTLTRAHIFGEADFTTKADSHEGCCSIIMEGSRNSGVDACTVSKSPGFNFSFGATAVIPGTSSVSVSKSTFEPGNINKNGMSDNSVTEWHFRTIGFLDVSGLGDYYVFNYSQGYFGYPYLRSRLYSIYFYDVNRNFISMQKYNWQAYEYTKPANAKFARIVIYQENTPTLEDTDFNAVAFLRSIGSNFKCFVRNSKLENNFSTGLAMCGSYDCIIEGNIFSGNNGRMPGCDIDWEDGWENMIGDIVRNNTFNSNTGVIFSAGAIPAVYDNTFNNSAMIMYGRTQNYRVFDNEFNGKGGGTRGIYLATQGDSYFSRNVLYDMFYNTPPELQHPTANYKVHLDGNTLL